MKHCNASVNLVKSRWFKIKIIWISSFLIFWLTVIGLRPHEAYLAQSLSKYVVLLFVIENKLMSVSFSG